MTTIVEIKSGKIQGMIQDDLVVFNGLWREEGNHASRWNLRSRRRSQQ